MTKRSQPTVMIVDIGADYQRKVSELARRLEEERGIKVVRPENIVELVQELELSTIPMHNHVSRPDLVVNLHFERLDKVKEALRAVHLADIRMINPYVPATITSHRLQLSYLLRRARVKTPDFYFGHPKKIPPEFGDQVVFKELRGHLVTVGQRDKIHSLEELVYVEKLIPNPSERIKSVYYVGGYVFTAMKVDDFNTNGHKPEKEIVPTSREDVALVKRLSRAIDLCLFNIDFIGETVIDMNAWPNFFFYEPAVDAMIDHICSIVGVKIKK